MRNTIKNLSVHHTLSLSFSLVNLLPKKSIAAHGMQRAVQCIYIDISHPVESARIIVVV